MAFRNTLESWKKAYRFYIDKEARRKRVLATQRTKENKDERAVVLAAVTSQRRSSETTGKDRVSLSRYAQRTCFQRRWKVTAPARFSEWSESEKAASTFKE